MRFVYKVEDLYPDVAVALGTFREGSGVTRGFRALSRALLRSADAAVALDSAMGRELSTRGAREVEVIPNWAIESAIGERGESGASFRAEHGLDDRFVVLYSGNLGLAHRFDAVTTAARRLEDEDSRIVFLFVGDGPRAQEVRSACTGLDNVKFLPYQPRERIAEMYAAADVHLVTLRDEVAGLLVPSKYAAALASGRPVLLVGGRGVDLFDEIGTAEVGWAVNHDPVAVVDALWQAVGHPDTARAAGRRARALFERRYTRQQATAAWRALLMRVVGRETATASGAGGEAS
jgi:glycosyltransferase involved in cell wall biosynthesis